MAKSAEATDDVDMKWGETRSFPYAAGSWHLKFDSFDSRHNDYLTSITDPFITVDAGIDSVTVRAADPVTLLWP